MTLGGLAERNGSKVWRDRISAWIIEQLIGNEPWQQGEEDLIKATRHAVDMPSSRRTTYFFWRHEMHDICGLSRRRPGLMGGCEDTSAGEAGLGAGAEVGARGLYGCIAIVVAERERERQRRGDEE